MGKISPEPPHVNRFIENSSSAVSESETIALPGGASETVASKVLPFEWPKPEDRITWVEQSDLTRADNRVARQLCYEVMHAGPRDLSTKKLTVKKLHEKINQHRWKGEKVLTLRTVERGFSKLVKMGFVERSSDNTRRDRRRKAKGGRWIRLTGGFLSRCSYENHEGHDFGITVESKEHKTTNVGNGPSPRTDVGNGPSKPARMSETVPHTHRRSDLEKNTRGIQTVPSDVTSSPVERPAPVETPSTRFSREVEAVTDELELVVAREVGTFVEDRGRTARLIEVKKALRRYTVEELTEAVIGALEDGWPERNGVDIVAHAARRVERYLSRHGPPVSMRPEVMVEALIGAR